MKNKYEKSELDEISAAKLKEKISYETELDLTRLIRKYKKRKYIAPNGGLDGLRKYLWNTTGHKIDEEKLSRLAGKTDKRDDEINISLADLKAFNHILDEEDKLTSLALLTKDRHFLKIFGAETQLDLFIPARFNTEVHSNVSNLFHLRVLEMLQRSNSVNLHIKFWDVVNKVADMELIRKTDWYNSLDDKGNSIRMTCGNGFINSAVEIFLAEKIFSVPPYQEVQRLEAPKENQEDNRRLPFYTCFPKRDRQGIDCSSFDVNSERAVTRFEGYRKEYEDKRCFIIGKNVYVSDNREDIEHKSELDNYGVLILRVCPPNEKDRTSISVTYSCLIGSYAPVHLGIVERLFTNKYDVPFLVPHSRETKEPHVLIVVIKTTIGRRKRYEDYEYEDLKKVEWREVNKIEIIDAALWRHDPEKDTWTERETLETATIDNYLIMPVDKDNPIETKLH